MIRPLLLLMPVLALSLAGCARDRGYQGYIVDEALVSGIQPGVDNKQSVEATLGQPTFTGEFTPDEWYYVSRITKQYGFSRPSPVGQTILHVTFAPDGSVAAVDRRGLEQVASISPDGDHTPTLGRDRSLFEDLFGNIGTVGAPGGAGGQAGRGQGQGG